MGATHIGGSIRSGALFAGLGAATYALAVAIVNAIPATDVTVLTLFALAALILLPFTTFGFYAARRWLHVEPAPLFSRAPASRSLLIPMVAVAAALVVVVGTLPVSLLLDPTMETPEEHPFAGMDGGDLLGANVIIIAEEIVFRLAIFFPLVAAFGARRLDRTARPEWRVWLAILVSGVLFGLAHAPDAEILGAPLLEYAIFAVVQKGLLAGTVFGYVAWRWGIEASILTHYATNLFFFVIAIVAI